MTVSRKRSGAASSTPASGWRSVVTIPAKTRIAIGASSPVRKSRRRAPVASRATSATMTRIRPSVSFQTIPPEGRISIPVDSSSALTATSGVSSSADHHLGLSPSFRVRFPRLEDDHLRVARRLDLALELLGVRLDRREGVVVAGDDALGGDQFG